VYILVIFHLSISFVYLFVQCVGKKRQTEGDNQTRVFYGYAKIELKKHIQSSDDFDRLRAESYGFVANFIRFPAVQKM